MIDELFRERLPILGKVRVGLRELHGGNRRRYEIVPKHGRLIKCVSDYPKKKSATHSTKSYSDLDTPHQHLANH